jgi:hypothetical protein
MSKNKPLKLLTIAPFRLIITILLILFVFESQLFTPYIVFAEDATNYTVIINGTYISDDGITKQTWTFSGTNKISMKMNYLIISSEGTYRLDGDKLYITNTMFGSTSTSVYNISKITANSFYIDDTIFEMSGSPTDPAPVVPEPEVPNPEPETPSVPPIIPTPEPTTTKHSTQTPNPAQITRPSNAFLMGEDNYSFGNFANSFGYSKDPNISKARFQQIFTPSEANEWFKVYYNLHGNCFGFSSTSSLFNRGVLTPSTFQKNVDRAYNFGMPKNNASLKELIELYQISQSLYSVNNAERANQNDYSGLISEMYNADGTVNKSGVLISVKKPGLGHSIIAYDITNAGNGIYYLSIYDNNNPKDTSRKMTVNTSNKTWQYDSYSSAKEQHVFRYLNSSVVYKAIQNALSEQSQPNQSSSVPATDMYISIPSQNATILQNATPVNEITNAIDVTPATGEEYTQSVWFVPVGVYTIDITNPKMNDSIAIFDDSSAFGASVDKNASVTGTIGANGFITVDTDGKLSIDYTNNDLFGEEVIISGKTNEPFTFNASDGDMVISGSGNFEVSYKERTGIYELNPSEPLTIELSSLTYPFPWTMTAVGVGAIIMIIIILVKNSRKINHSIKKS